MPQLTTRSRDLVIVLGITALAVALRVGELSPTSLFVDDQWVAYIDRVGLGESARIGLTSVGFVAGLKAWFAVVGFNETSAQLPALIAGSLTPALLYLVVRRWINWPFGLLAAGLLTVNQLHITYSYYVKQYTLDALWSVACLAIGVELMRRGLYGRTAYVGIAAAALAAAISFTTIVASFGVFALIAWMIVGEAAALRSSTEPADRPLRRSRAFIVTGVAMLISGLVIVSWYALLIRPNVTEGIRNYWSDHYVDRRGFVTSIRSLATRYVELVANTFNLDDRSIAAVVATAICGLLIAVAVFKQPVPTIVVGGPLALAGVLAFLGLAPLGGGRTDLHLIVLVIGGTMGGLHVVLSAATRRWLTADGSTATESAAAKSARVAPLALTGLLALNAALIDRPEPRPYPDNDSSVFVRMIDAQRSPSEAIVLHRSVYAYGLYSERPSRPVSDGYHFAPSFLSDVPMTRLRWSTDGPIHVDALARVAETSDGIWLLSSPIGGPGQLDEISDILEQRLGFRLEERTVGRNAVLDHWVRPGS